MSYGKIRSTYWNYNVFKIYHIVYVLLLQDTNMEILIFGNYVKC